MIRRFTGRRIVTDHADYIKQQRGAKTCLKFKVS